MVSRADRHTIHLDELAGERTRDDRVRAARTPRDVVWVGLDGDEIVSGHLFATQQKFRNIRRDPRVSLSIEGTEIQPPGLLQYLVVHGQARLTDGGAPELLQELAHRYLGPDVKFPPMPGPPPGVVMHIAVDRLGGIGPWAAPRS